MTKIGKVLEAINSCGCNESSKIIKDMDKDEIQGEVEYFLLNSGVRVDSSSLSNSIKNYLPYLRTEYGNKKITKPLALKIYKNTL